MKNTRGFTLVETLVAVSILTLSVSAPLYTASRAIVAAEISRDQLTASYLAQEGIEYARMMRDDAYLSAYQVGGANISTVAWTAFLSGGSTASITQCITTTCTLDPARPMGVGSSLQPCSGGTCTPLYLSNGIYTMQQVGTKTAFKRTVRASTILPTEELITSTVSWDFHGTTHMITVTDHLTPWQ